MKLKDFIAEALKLDPSGESQLSLDNGDVWFLESKPWYYDGKAKIFIRDEKGKVIGMRAAKASDGDKICVHTQTARDLGWEAEENKKHGTGPTEYIFEADQPHDLQRMLDDYEKGKQDYTS